MNLHPHKIFKALPAWLVLLAGQGMAGPARGSELILHPEPAHFNICFNHSCQSLADVSFTTGQWQEIRGLFSPEPVSPREERERIAQAVGKLEALAGRLTGIDNDRGGSMAGLWARNQMDCIDESTNTRTYLVMLKNDGLLKYHVPAANERRFRWLYQHYSAVIEETGTHEKYAVDSWFYDNGQPAVILRLGVWKQNWYPGDEIPEADEEKPAVKSGNP